MPAKKRTTKTTNAAAPASVTPAITPDAVLASKKDAAAPKAEKKAGTKRPPAKRPKSEPVAVAPEVVVASAPETVVDVPVVADAPTAQVHSIISEDDIRRHAYKLSQSRRGPGDPIADWFEAERQLREQHA